MLSQVVVVSEATEAVCSWCGEPFSYTPSERGGTPPRYCRRSHRQRAYEARKAATTVQGSGGRHRDADPLGILSAIEQQVLVLSQSRVRQRPSIDGVRAAAEIEAILEQHAVMVVLEAGREGTPFVEVAEAMRMSEADTNAWITATLGPEPDDPEPDERSSQ